MKELKKVSHDLFANYYEGENGNLRVTAILDDHRVRYMVLKRTTTTAPWKLTSRREFDDTKKATCLMNATKALNK